MTALYCAYNNVQGNLLPSSAYKASSTNWPLFDTQRSDLKRNFELKLVESLSALAFYMWCQN